MADTPQGRAVKKYRSRLTERGMARFEVIGRHADRAVVRSFAKCLAEGGRNAEALRAVVRQTIAGEPPRKGAILEALRRSPLVGADAIAARPPEPGRKVAL